MTRITLLAVLAVGLAFTTSAQSQTDEAPAVVATDSTDAAPELDPERARELYDEGTTLIQGGDYAGALVKLDEAMVLNPGYAPAELRRGQALAQLGRLGEAQTAFAAAVEFSEGSDASNASQIATAAQRALDQITTALEQRAAAAAEAAAAQEANAAATATTGKVNEAIALLQGINITDTTDANFGPASDGLALLEQARLAGYDADLAAEYYAIAYNAMGQGADAVPHAETALANADASADNSRLYILLGLAHMGAGDADAARAAFESVTDGQTWHGWAVHFLGQLDAQG